MANQIRGKGSKRGPSDTLQVPSPSANFNFDAGNSQYVFQDLWGTGAYVAEILTNVRAETPFTLVGGASLYQPTIAVHGWSDLYIYSPAVSDLHFEYVVYTPWGAGTTNDLTGDSNNFSTAWGDSYDARPSGYEFWSSTSLLRNYAAWTKGSILSRRPVFHGFGVAPVGKPLKLRFPFRTRYFRFQDYSSSTFLTSGQIANKSFRVLLRVWGEHGQICGESTAVPAVPTPVIHTVGAPFMTKTVQHYNYRFIPGNNRPTVYGSNFDEDMTIDAEANGWLGINALKAQRGAAYSRDIEVSAGYPNFGALAVNRKPETNINPVDSCETTTFRPDVEAT